ncbi:hypothetical protein AB5J72_49065 [Streptomyces sp. CG1]|uniref:hypothetical protein n=1 Tax=Streptomyces sp. CG1 TaxID=1287523 RepID=UPI0034E2D5EC
MSRLQWLRTVERAADIVTSYDEVGDCSLRQAYYVLVSEERNGSPTSANGEYP